MPAGFMIADIFPNKEFTFAPITPPPDPIQEPIFNFPLIPAYSDVKREEPVFTYTSYLNSVFPYGRRNVYKKARKLTMTYKQMIIVAMGASPNKMVNLAQLTDWIHGHFPECRERSEKSCKGSIRTALTRHEEFQKVESFGENGVAYWTWNFIKAVPCKRNSGRALDMALLAFFLQSNTNPDCPNRVTLEDVMRAAREARGE